MTHPDDLTARERRQPAGMAAFWLVWAGQLISMLTGLSVIAGSYSLPIVRNVKDILPDHEAVDGDALAPAQS